MRNNIRALKSMTSSTDKSATKSNIIAPNATVYRIFLRSLEFLTIDDVITDGRRVPFGKYSLNYFTPTTYLARNKQIELKKIPDKKGFMPDGPIYTISKEKRGAYNKPIVYGKDGKQPPHSYLKQLEWAKKKDNKVDKTKLMRKTYIDEVISYNTKYKWPGPDQYFKGKEKKEAKKNMVDGKKLVRPCFLDDPQYLGMNVPAPGLYKIVVILLEYL